MYSQEMLLILLLLLASNDDFDFNNNNIILIIAVMLIGFPQFPPFWNNGCGCGRNRFFINSFWFYHTDKIGYLDQESVSNSSNY